MKLIKLLLSISLLLGCEQLVAYTWTFSSGSTNLPVTVILETKNGFNVTFDVAPGSSHQLDGKIQQQGNEYDLHTIVTKVTAVAHINNSESINIQKAGPIPAKNLTLNIMAPDIFGNFAFNMVSW